MRWRGGRCHLTCVDLLLFIVPEHGSSFCRHSSEAGGALQQWSGLSKSCSSVFRPRPAFFRSPSGRAAYFLCLCKESRQRNTPRAPRPAGILPFGYASPLRVPQTAHPCADCGIGAIHRAAPAGFSSAASPRLTGAPEERRTFHVRRGKSRAKQSRRSRAEKAEQKKQSTIALHLSSSLLLLRTWNVRCSSGAPFAAARGRRKGRVAGMRRRRMRSQPAHGCAVANPGVRERTCRAGCPEGAAAGVSSLATFLDKQESSPLAGKASGTPNGRVIQCRIVPSLALDSGSPCRNDGTVG